MDDDDFVMDDEIILIPEDECDWTCYGCYQYSWCDILKEVV